MMTAALYVGAALAEIGGCFAFWLWWREGRSALWIAPGIALLVLFALLLARIPTDAAGRAYAAYGGVYIAMSLFWLWLIEGKAPSGTDLAGAAVALAGAAIILAGAARA